MASTTINVLVSSFPGLGLPATLSIPLPADTTLEDLTYAIEERLPPVNNRLLLTTNANKLIRPSSSPLTSLLSSHESTILPLRLSAPLCGGKGGFGSQLRAAGGRMSSRKKTGERNGSNRNLDGRRLRTVTEAKALAEYLAVKPEMDRKEKEERRKRWEQVVEATEKREEELRSGKGKGKVDEEWVEQKEKAESGARGDILRALKAGEIKNVLGNVEESGSGTGESSEGGSESEDEIPAKVEAPSSKGMSKAFYGWDDEDDDMSEEEEEQADQEPMTKGKGKAQA